jgi:uncharacterized membrane protein
MTRWLSRAVCVSALAVAMLMGGAGKASAWYKVKNSTPNTVWVSHAYWSMTGLGCGWNDGCDNNSTSGWAVHGWWQISPGGVAILLTQDYGNAAHQLFANDSFGHVWGNNGFSFGTPNTVFARCEGLFTELNMPYLQYRTVRATACCGVGCTTNFTTNLTL